MSAIANIAIQDGQGTPVTHTFYPIQTGPTTKLRENLTALPTLGQGVVSVVTRLDGKAGLNRVRVVLELPALEAETGANSSGYTAAPKVAYMNKVTAEFILPSRGTAAQRKDLRTLMSNLVLNAVVSDSIDNLNQPY